MPNQKRCYMPQKDADGLPKKTKDNWNAYFVFDADKVPAGMVCKDIVPKVKPPAAVATPSVGKAPKPVPVAVPQTAHVQPSQAPTATESINQGPPAAVPSQQSATTQENPAIIDSPKSDTSFENSPAALIGVPNQSQPEPAGVSTPTMVAIGVVTALLVNMTMKAFSATAPKGKAPAKAQKGKSGAQQARQSQQDLQQQQEKKQEEERKQCGLQTDAAKSDADHAVQRVDAVLVRARKVEKSINDQTGDMDLSTDDLDKSMKALHKRITKLERTRLIK